MTFGGGASKLPVAGRFFKEFADDCVAVDDLAGMSVGGGSAPSAGEPTEASDAGSGVGEETSEAIEMGFVA